MSFFVLDKDPHSGVLRLPVDGMFATREEALAALSGAIATGDAAVTGQVYVADLETALPVLVMPTAPAPVEAPVVETEFEEESHEAPSATIDDDIRAEAGQGPELEPVQGTGDAEPASLVEPEAVSLSHAESPIDVAIFDAAAGGISLADALKRAATSLEDEGIVAPESISADDFTLEEEPLADSVEPEPQGAASEVTIDAGQEVAEPMSAVDREPAEVLTAPADWPWSNVEAFTEEAADEVPMVEPDDALTKEAALDTIAPAELPGVDSPTTQAPRSVIDFDESETLITSAPPAGEDAYLPRPVILGDYADAADPMVADVEEPGGEVAFLEVSTDPSVIPDEPAAFGTPEPIAGDDVLADPFAAILEDLAPAPEEPLPERSAPEIGYEPTGDLDLSAYTCNDCVYSNTCPKVGEVTPAECGTFQWRAS